MIVFVTDPHYKIVKDAQLVTTIVGLQGDQLMRWAKPFKDGYLVSTKSPPPGISRLKCKTITKGYLLTDEFSFRCS